MEGVGKTAPSLLFHHDCKINSKKNKIMMELTNNLSTTTNANSEDVHLSSEFKKFRDKVSIMDYAKSLQHSDDNPLWKPDQVKSREWTLVGSGNDSATTMNMIVDTSDSHSWKREQGRASSSSSITSSITEDVGGIGDGDVPNSHHYNKQRTSDSHMNTNNTDITNLPPLYHRTKHTMAFNNDSKKNHPSNHNNHHANNNSSSSSTLCSDDAFSYTMMNFSSHSSSSTYSIQSNTSLKSDEYAMIEHIVLPKDTMQGICLQYKINVTRLRQVNKFSGSSLSLAPKKLYIPIKNKWWGSIKLQDTSTEEFKIHKILSECNKLGTKEVEA